MTKDRLPVDAMLYECGATRWWAVPCLVSVRSKDHLWTPSACGSCAKQRAPPQGGWQVVRRPSRASREKGKRLGGRRPAIVAGRSGVLSVGSVDLLNDLPCRHTASGCREAFGRSAWWWLCRGFGMGEGRGMLLLPALLQQSAEARVSLGLAVSCFS